MPPVAAVVARATLGEVDAVAAVETGEAAAMGEEGSEASMVGMDDILHTCGGSSG